jgi:hypothetical protein
MTEQKQLNIPYYCHVCKTKNNKWQSIYYQTEGQMLMPAKGVYLSICSLCEKVKIMEMKINETSSVISG